MNFSRSQHRVLKCQIMVHVKSENFLRNILWLQWLAGMTAMLMLFTFGLMIGWSSPYLAQLTANGSPLPITTSEASWVASFLNLGRFLGAIIGGVTVSYIDSKRTLIILGFPILFSWICIIMANSVMWLYVARIAAGISLGMSFSSFPIFIGEISSPTLRGALVSLTMTGMAFGNLVGNIMGAYMSMSQFSYVGLVPNFVFILLFMWLPQSPYFLVRNKRMEDAKKAIARYDPNVDPKIEAESLGDFIATSESLTIRDRLREFNIPRNRKAGLITLMLYFFMQFSGLNSIVFYLELILTAAMVTIIPPSTLVIISSTVGVLSGWLSVYTADKFERKVLISVSSAGVGLSMCAFGIHFVLLANGFDPDALQWLPITSILIFQLSVCNGITTIPNIILSEFFAPNIKNLAACFASISIGLFAFVAVKSWQPLVDTIGEAYVFFANAILLVICIIFSLTFLPKTRGKSLQEIQDALMRK